MFVTSFRKIYELVLFAIVFFLTACASSDQKYSDEFDTLIIGATVFYGEANNLGIVIDVGITEDKIIEIGELSDYKPNAKQVIDASGLILAPGFIDPHTHADQDLRSPQLSQNLNYLTQGVTTVFVGNDGGGPIDIEAYLSSIEDAKPGTNVATFIGHGTLRRHVVGELDREPTVKELNTMRRLVRVAMQNGALGLSAGLYYVPGSFANTQELVELAKEIAPFNGVYESHLRDEGSYSIGLLNAIKEALDIGEKANTKVHIAHIKALGVDVWGKSAEVISMIESAQKSGLRVTADQYPWQASGTRISNALIPAWAKSGGVKSMQQRLQDPLLLDRINKDIVEALRIRGGSEALLITGGKQHYFGKTLGQIAKENQLDVVAMARKIVIEGDARVASFNMDQNDIVNFMKRKWVMTSSDGTQGHPRKFASFPRKYSKYVQTLRTLKLGEFIHRSSGLVADTFSIPRRGYIRKGFYADLVLFDPTGFKDNADFFSPEELSEGVIHLFVNGKQAIKNGVPTDVRSGRVLKRASMQPSSDVKAKVSAQTEIHNDNLYSTIYRSQQVEKY